MLTWRVHEIKVNKVINAQFFSAVVQQTPGWIGGSQGMYSPASHLCRPFLCKGGNIFQVWYGRHALLFAEHWLWKWQSPAKTPHGYGGYKPVRKTSLYNTYCNNLKNEKRVLSNNEK